MAISDYIICYAALRNGPFRRKELSSWLDEKNIPHGSGLQTQLNRLLASGRLVKTGWGEYRLADGVKPRLRTLMEEIIVNDQGRVVGVKIRENYRFPKKDSGKVKYLAAKRGLVLCYGGFSADAEFRQIYDPKLTCCRIPPRKNSSSSGILGIASSCIHLQRKHRLMHLRVCLSPQQKKCWWTSF